MMNISAFYDFLLQAEKIIDLFASVDPLDWRGDCQFCTAQVHSEHDADCVWKLMKDLHDKIFDLRADQSELETLRSENRRLRNDLDTLSHAVHGWERERTAHELGEMAVEYNDRIHKLEAENERLRAALEKYANIGSWVGQAVQGSDDLVEYVWDDVEFEPWQLAQDALNPASTEQTDRSQR